MLYFYIFSWIHGKHQDTGVIPLSWSVFRELAMCFYLCRRKVCTMLPLMMLRASHTSMATMFLVRALEKLSLGTATVPPASTELVLLVSRSRGLEEVELSISNISSLQSEVTQTWNLFYSQIQTVLFIQSFRDEFHTS